jgi:glycosyltransferase involved in cell wall biosynthesis
MNILMTLHNFFPEKIQGAEWVCIQQIRELLKRGHKVGLFYAGNTPASKNQLAENGLEALELFRVRFLNTKAQILLSACNPKVRRRFETVVDAFSPDVIIYHHLVRLSLDLPVVGWQRNIPSVYYFHDFYLICPSYSLLRPDNQICAGGGILKCARCLYTSRAGRFAMFFPLPVFFALPFLFTRKLLISRLIQQVTLFVSPSQFLVNEMAERGLPAERCVVIQNGTDVAKNFSSPVITERIRFGFIGGIHQKKGIETLQKAFRGDLGKTLLIRGFASDRHLKRFRQDYPQFQATLELFNSNKKSFYDNIDVLVVPSIWYENQPTVIIEAYQFGKPVVCSNIGGMKEIVHHHISGLLFKPGDADDCREKIVYLLNNPSEVARLAAAIPKWPTSADSVNQLMDTVMRLRCAG